jgi:EmrB/QacA subfamily drug resistance transporter
MSARRANWTLAVLCLAVGIVIASITSLYIAGPEVAKDIGASQTQLTWIIDVYTLAMAGLLLPAGALGDRFGRREVMIAGPIIFVAAATALQFVTTPEALIAARAVLGIGSALILPATLSLITSTFPPDLRDRGVSIWTAAFTMAGVLGGGLAAVLLEFFTWRSAFWSVLVGAVLVLIASPRLPTSRDEEQPPVDAVGAGVSLLAVSLLVYAFIQAGIDGWTDPMILGTLAGGIAATAAFVLIQLRRTHPLLDVRVFANRSFAAGAFTVFMAFAGVYALAFLIIPYQQIVLGDSALVASLPMSATGVTIIPVTIVARRATAALGLRTIVVLGNLLIAIGFCLLATLGDKGLWGLYMTTLTLGAGLGLAMVPCTEAIMQNVPASKQGVAASVNHTAREVGTTLGVALVGGLLAGVYSDKMHAATAALPTPARDASRDSVAAALQIASQLGDRGNALAAQARDAYVQGMQHTALILAAIMFLAGVVAAVWAPPRRAPSRSETDTAAARQEPSPA